MKHIGWFIHICYALLIGSVLLLPKNACSQPLKKSGKFSKEDSLRGSIGPGRDWWDVQEYTVSVTPDFTTKTINGSVGITFKVLKPGKKMQIDLQSPLIIDSIGIPNVDFSKIKKVNDTNTHLLTFTGVKWSLKKLKFKREGNVAWVDMPALKKGQTELVIVYYHGKPREAVNPPWDGGWIWKKDDKGNPWMTVACQGLGASVWYPCKDHQSDEPDKGALLCVTVPDSLVAVGNGHLETTIKNNNGTTEYKWQVDNPINNYNIVPYIGKYIQFSDSYKGETGETLPLNYWVMAYNKDKAKKQFDRDVKRMLEAFEYWFGPYPFYEDGFKLVETPHLGMEHQSAIAYGNHYMDGYLGTDLSGSGWGLKWDYIIVHEAGHEWFGNNITTNDIADMWVHEGFTMYSEVLFIEYFYGKKAADQYVQGLRPNIDNDKPLIGPYGVNQEGSGDMYNKGANLIHTIRQVIDNDSLFRQILRGLNKDFYHKTVTSRQVEAYISKKTGKDFSKVFDQYLRTTNIPVLDIRGEKDSITYCWKNVVKGFAMPVKLSNGEWIYPTEKDKSTKLVKGSFGLMNDKNFYIRTQLGLPE